MVVAPADHIIKPTNVFQDAVRYAARLVQQDSSKIVTFGIRPTYPAEVFGYIERGDQETGEAPFPTFRVTRFREKPNAELAKQFFESKRFYWNSGIFVWKAKTILNALREFEPLMYDAIHKIADSILTSRYLDVLQREFTAIKGKSIDFAVMERYENVTVIEAPFDWDDLGNWSALPRLLSLDAHGNAVDGKHIGIATEKTIIKSVDEHLIVTVGMKDCIVVHTPDATLIANRNDESMIKQVVEELEKRQWLEYL
jgi:mannose-1-phosphate guanylyltransferase